MWGAREKKMACDLCNAGRWGRTGESGGEWGKKGRAEESGGKWGRVEESGRVAESGGEWRRVVESGGEWRNRLAWCKLTLCQKWRKPRELALEIVGSVTRNAWQQARKWGLTGKIIADLPKACLQFKDADMPPCTCLQCLYLGQHG